MVENGIVNEKGCIWLVAQMLGLVRPRTDLEIFRIQRDAARREGRVLSGDFFDAILGYRERVEGLLMVVETPSLLTEFAGIVSERVKQVLETPRLEAIRWRFQLDNQGAVDLMGFPGITALLCQLPDYTGIKIGRVRDLVGQGIVQVSYSERTSGPIMQFLELQGNQGSR
ncbi:hypothetical protein A3D02_01080 [Candidatus Daviesbacteria bacterium RIFCSPHIGHO2_02_FULL_39_41]|nr:MAG: hypothetical protein A3D02_01080 [Candidatus Daviesbacteria bacterium RIFCSPHIGHO2_02_FULL_39_41]